MLVRDTGGIERPYLSAIARVLKPRNPPGAWSISPQGLSFAADKRCYGDSSPQRETLLPVHRYHPF
jgi:hypothetical protein